MEAAVKNITLALDEKIIKKGHWLEECFRLMDQVALSRATRKWKREDLYRA
jgi:hypothetical protein